MCPAMPSTKMTRTSTELPSASALAAFLAEYTSWLMGCGSTCIRIEKNVTRIAAAYGKRAEITVMTRHIQLSVFDCGCDSGCVTLNTSVRHTPVNFDMNTRLSELSWQIADRGIPLDEARERLQAIVSRPPRSKWLVLLLVTLANAAFCRLFGGDALAMAIVAVATCAGFWLKGLLLERHMDVRAVFIICAFVSSVLGSSGILFAMEGTPAVALATSVLYLVPGIPFLNSFSDMLYRHYVCAFSRFCDAMVLTACLSIGLCLGMLAMNTGMF